MRALAPQARAVSPVPPIVHEVVRSSGLPLEPDVRAAMETRFGHDFSHVRVHADGRAAESARAVNALAYTVGREVVFDRGHYAPQTLDGRRLLAHELTHVVQQRAAVPRGELRAAPDDDPAEVEAAALAAGRVGTAPAARHGGGEQTLLRQKSHCAEPGPWRPDTDITVALIDPASGCTSTHVGNPEVDADVKPFSEKCPPVICAGTQVPFELLYGLDCVEHPRPQPFDPRARISVQAELEPAAGGGGPENVLVSREFTGEYQGPGERLKPSFDVEPWLVPPVAGTLYLSVALSDPSSGTLVVYSDALPVADSETWPLCPAAPGESGGYATGIQIHVPDPKNAPLEYSRVYGMTHLPGEEIFVVMHDDDGDFYWYEGRKVYLPGGVGR